MLKWHEHFQWQKYQSPPLGFASTVWRSCCKNHLFWFCFTSQHSCHAVVAPLTLYNLKGNSPTGGICCYGRNGCSKMLLCVFKGPWPYFPSRWHLISTVYFCAEPRSKVEAWVQRVGPHSRSTHNRSLFDNSLPWFTQSWVVGEMKPFNSVAASHQGFRSRRRSHSSAIFRQDWSEVIRPSDHVVHMHMQFTLCYMRAINHILHMWRGDERAERRMVMG